MIAGQNTAAKRATKEEMSRRQFETIDRSIMEIKDKLDALTEFLGVRISKNYKKYNVRETRRLRQDICDEPPKPPKRGLFSFLRNRQGR